MSTNVKAAVPRGTTTSNRLTDDHLCCFLLGAVCAIGIGILCIGLSTKNDDHIKLERVIRSESDLEIGSCISSPKPVEPIFGPWSPHRKYAPLEMAYYAGRLWIAMNETNDSTPREGNGNWLHIPYKLMEHWNCGVFIRDSMKVIIDETHVNEYMLYNVMEYWNKAVLKSNRDPNKMLAYLGMHLTSDIEKFVLTALDMIQLE